MKLTQELIDKIQEAMLHTNLKGEINWKDGDDIEVNLAGTFAKDKFIVIKNKSKDPVVSASCSLQPSGNLPSPRSKIESGTTCLTSSSTLVSPKSVSISACSFLEGPMWRWINSDITF